MSDCAGNQVKPNGPNALRKINRARNPFRTLLFIEGGLLAAWNSFQYLACDKSNMPMNWQMFIHSRGSININDIGGHVANRLETEVPARFFGRDGRIFRVSKDIFE